MTNTNEKDTELTNPVEPEKSLSQQEIKMNFIKGILQVTNLSEESRLNLLSSLEGTWQEAQFMRMAISNNSVAIARGAGQEKGKAKNASLIDFYEENSCLHTIKSARAVARKIIELVSEDKRAAENKFGVERTIAEKIRAHRKSKKES